jgi:hypothetical protein
MTDAAQIRVRHPSAAESSGGGGGRRVARGFQRAIAAEQIDVTNAGQIREELLLVINHGATALIADMTATVSCDHAGADAVVRAYQRAVVNGIQLRL